MMIVEIPALRIAYFINIGSYGEIREFEKAGMLLFVMGESALMGTRCGQ
ncbi:hypothetical protein RKD55_003362 [Rossellomorea marisflavi]